MKQIFEILGLLEKTAGLFGVEIEVEGENLLMLNTKGWRTEDDGSLRGSFPDQKAEYVFERPLSMTKSVTAIKDLAEHLKDSKLDFSFRTSVHVHLNVQELTEDQFFNLVYTYFLLENSLSNLWGEERKGNRFCLRLSDCDGLWETLVGLFGGGITALKRYRQEEIRYSALNLASVYKYGSLEFRGMQGNLNVERLSEWLKILKCMYDFSCKAGTVVDVHNLFTDVGPAAFVEGIFGKTLSKRVWGEASEREILTSFSLTIDLPYAYKEYSKKKESLERKISRVNPNEFMRKVLDHPPPGGLEPVFLEGYR